jgi:sulfur carrier protein ThiS
VVGASEIESEDRSPVVAAQHVELLAAAHSVLPELAEARVVHSETNLRPPAGQPAAAAAAAGLTRINGLFRHGWLIAPALVEDMALQDRSCERTAHDRITVQRRARDVAAGTTLAELDRRARPAAAALATAVNGEFVARDARDDCELRDAMPSSPSNPSPEAEHVLSHRRRRTAKPLLPRHGRLSLAAGFAAGHCSGRSAQVVTVGLKRQLAQAGTPGDFYRMIQDTGARPLAPTPLDAAPRARPSRWPRWPASCSRQNWIKL